VRFGGITLNITIELFRKPALLLLLIIFRIMCHRAFIFHMLIGFGLNQSELLCQFRLIGDRASDVSGGRLCLTQNAYAEI